MKMEKPEPREESGAGGRGRVEENPDEGGAVFLEGEGYV